MPILSLCSQKGGVGKTTIALSLATEWHARGVRTLVVDADDQGTALTWADVAAEGEHPAPPVVRMGDSLRAQLTTMAADYEMVIIDTPGRTGRRATFALGMSDLALLPCGPTGPEIWAMAATLELVRDVQAVRPFDACVVVTRKQVNTVIGRQAATALAETGYDVCKAELHYRLSYGEAITAGKGPTTYEPSGAAAAEVRALVDELERRLGMAKPRGRRKGTLRAV